MSDLAEIRHYLSPSLGFLRLALDKSDWEYAKVACERLAEGLEELDKQDFFSRSKEEQEYYLESFDKAVAAGVIKPNTFYDPRDKDGNY